MAFDKAVIFNCKKNINKSNEIVSYRFDNCDWGWLINSRELISRKYLGEIDFIKTLSPLETIKRYEIQKEKILELQNTTLKSLRNIYRQYKELKILNLFLNTKKDFQLFGRLIYDTRVINVCFNKHWWESGLN